MDSREKAVSELLQKGSSKCKEKLFAPCLMIITNRSQYVPARKRATRPFHGLPPLK